MIINKEQVTEVLKNGGHIYKGGWGVDIRYILISKQKECLGTVRKDTMTKLRSELDLVAVRDMFEVKYVMNNCKRCGREIQKGEKDYLPFCADCYFEIEFQEEYAVKGDDQ